MAPAICAAPIKGTTLRIVSVDTCGIPVSGASKKVVSSGFIKVDMDPDYEAGQEFLQRTASGALCVSQKDPSSLKRMKLSVDFCTVDPSAQPLVLGARLISSTPIVSGTGFAVPDGTPTTHFSLEVWQEVAGSGACDPSGAQRYIYNAWPNCNPAELGKYTVENNPSTFSIVTETNQPSPLWTAGYPWWGDYGALHGDETWLWNITTVAPPTPACGSTVYP